jgi:hypothetical protein
MKKETIEEAAKKFTENLYYKVGDADEFNGEPLAVYDAFMEGAKSDAARDYWFKIFKEQFIVESNGNRKECIVRKI